MADVVERIRLAAYAWCEADGRVLLCRIAPGVPGSGHWVLPGGGLDFGEDPAGAVLRELGEETGLGGRVDGLVGIRSRVYEPHETRSGQRVHAVAVLYRVTVTGGQLRDEQGGSSDRASWVGLGDLDTLPGVELLHWARGKMDR